MSCQLACPNYPEQTLKKLITISISTFLLFIPIITQGQFNNYYNSEYELYDYSTSDYISLINDSDKNSTNPESSQYEHPLRRFEITFFISLPFVFIATFVTLHMTDVIRKKDPNVNVWKDYKPALLAGTFGISSVIAFREAWICMETNKKRKEQNDQSLEERTFFLYAKKRF